MSEEKRRGVSVLPLFPSIVLRKRLELSDDLIEYGETAIHEFVRDIDVSVARRVTADKAKQTLHLDPSISLLMEPLLAEIKQLLYDELHFSEAITTFHVGRCWPVIQVNESEGSLHFHAGAVYSGVFFLKAPEGSGGLQFVRPFKTAADHLYRSEFTKESAQVCDVAIASKDLWLFNGELWHRALPNAPGVTEPRLAIAFDIYSTTHMSNRAGGMPPFEYLRSLTDMPKTVDPVATA